MPIPKTFMNTNPNNLTLAEIREKNYRNGYEMAIDDAMDASAKAICIGCGYLKGTKCTYKGGNCGVSKPMIETVMKALERLKAGV